MDTKGELHTQECDEFQKHQKNARVLLVVSEEEVGFLQIHVRGATGFLPVV